MKKFKPLISIIMNCYNGQRYLEESLKSVFNQDYKNWELIFFDNCSTDNSKKILKKFRDKRIKYYRSNKLLKLYDARNKAIEISKGKYISFLDTDDKWKKNKLMTQVKYLEKKKLSVLYSNYFIYNEKKNQNYLRNHCILPYGNITQDLLNDYSIGILTALVKRNVYKDIRFNSKYEIIGDFDFFIRISLKYKIGSINEPLATYRFHENNLSRIRLDLYIKELDYWLKKNLNKIKKFNLFKLRLYLTKLIIKKYFVI